MQFGNYRGSVYMHYPLLRKFYLKLVFDRVLYSKRERYFRLLETLSRLARA